MTRVKGLILNQKFRRFEYIDDGSREFIVGETPVSLAKIRAKSIIEEAIKNWNENNPTLKLKSE